VALIVALTLLQCSLKKPETPTWESTIRVPLVADHLDIANLLLRLDGGDQFVDAQGNIGIFLADTLDTVMLGADLAVPSQSIAVLQEVGRINISDLPGDTVREVLTDWYFGGTGSVGPFSISDIDTLGPFTQYTWIAPSSGQAWLRVENEFGLDFDSVTIWIDDIVAGPLGVYDFPGGIPTGMADSLPIDLAGRRLYNRFQYQMFARSPGGTLLSLSNHYLDVSFQFNDTVVIDSGLLEVPQIIRSHSDIIGFSGNADLIAIRAADLSAGTMDLTIENQTSLTSSVTLDIPSFTQGGVPLSRNVALLPGATVNVLIDLAGYQWVPEAPNPPQHFTVNMVAATVATAPSHALVHHDDSIFVTAQLLNLQGQSMTGVLAPQRLALPTWQESLDIPSELQAFHLANATLQIDLVNGSGATAALDFVLSANNGNSLPVTGTAAPGTALATTVSQIIEPGLASLLDPFPTSIQLDGTATFGDSVSEVTITAGDFAYARLSISAPLAVRIDSVTIQGTTESQDIVGTDIPGFTDDLLNGTLHVDVFNHLPVAVDLRLFVATDSARVYTAPDLQLGPVTVAAGATDISGVVFDATRSINQLDLTHDDLQLFDSTTVYFGYHVFMYDSGGQVVLFSNADYLDLTAWFDVTLRNGKEAW